jgi:type II secretory pathway pseudopilin PulG
VLALIALIASFVLALSGVAVGQSTTQKQASIVDADLRPFQQAVEQYITLHRRLRQEIPELTPGSDAKQLNTTSDALARAIQRARPKARQGDFFSAAPTRAIKQRIQELLQNPAYRDLLMGIDDEPPKVGVPRIYLRYPDGAQLATMPPTLLQALPPLPPELEYRIVGRFLVLRDTHASLILDYIAQVVPASR